MADEQITRAEFKAFTKSILSSFEDLKDDVGKLGTQQNDQHLDVMLYINNNGHAHEEFDAKIISIAETATEIEEKIEEKQKVITDNVRKLSDTQAEHKPVIAEYKKMQARINKIAMALIIGLAGAFGPDFYSYINKPPPAETAKPADPPKPKPEASP